MRQYLALGFLLLFKSVQYVFLQPVKYHENMLTSFTLSWQPSSIFVTRLTSDVIL